MAIEPMMNSEEHGERPASLDETSTGGSGTAAAASEGSERTASASDLQPGTTDVQAYIGRQLRAVYDDVVKQPIPDRFIALMKQLEDGTRGS